MNQVIEAIKNRRSVRSFTERQIEADVLEQILEAATYAPSGMGFQSPKIVVLQDQEMIHVLQRLNGETMGKPEEKVFYGAPTVAVVFADTEISTCVEDGSLVIGTMMLAADALGVSSCWIHRAKEEFESEEGRRLKESWGIGEKYVGVGHCILGYADGEKTEAKPRKEDYIIRI